MYLFQKLTTKDLNLNLDSSGSFSSSLGIHSPYVLDKRHCFCIVVPCKSCSIRHSEAYLRKLLNPFRNFTSAHLQWPHNITKPSHTFQRKDTRRTHIKHRC